MKLFVLFCTMLMSVVCFSQEDKHMLVAMRMAGHRILLASGDSSSRVLPVEQNGNNYKLRFESEFQFEPQKLVTLIDTLLKKQNITEHYIVEVEACNTNTIVYSYEMGLTNQTSLIPCQNRIQPKACYNVLITILDKKPEIITASGSRVLEFSLLLSILGIGSFLILRRTRTIEKSNSFLPKLGHFELDEKNMQLKIGNQKIELSGKEMQLLTLLLSSKNKTVTKEVILQTVWEDDGDYIGRTLDVFISKLRKKLEADPDIKIINIRGIGYKLVVNE